MIALIPSSVMSAAAELPDRERRVVAAQAIPAYRLLALGALLVVALVASLGFAVDMHDIAVMLMLIGACIGLALAMRWCRLPLPADAIEGAAVILASGMTTGCLSVMLATLAPPFRDSELAGADRWLFPFISWPGMAHALSGHPAIVAAMQAVYTTLLWQPFALLALLAVTGRHVLLWRFVHAWLLVLTGCLAIFAVVPAVTAQVHYGFPPGSIAGLTVNAGWRPTELLLQVRGGSLHTLASGSMAGLIDFPSFHAAGAMLLAWGFAQAGPVGRPMVALNIAMITTVPLIGSHYFTDVLAGIATAIAVIAATRPRPPCEADAR